MSELKNEKSNKEKRSKQKKHSYEKWTTPIKRSTFKGIYNYVADLINNNTDFRINDNEIISRFLEDINNDKFNTRDDAINFSERIYREYESKLNLIKAGDAEIIKNTYNRVKNMIYNLGEKEGQGLKILSPKQMITRLPILLAQLKAGNNSGKLKNEIDIIYYNCIFIIQIKKHE